MHKHMLHSILHNRQGIISIQVHRYFFPRIVYLALRLLIEVDSNTNQSYSAFFHFLTFFINCNF